MPFPTKPLIRALLVGGLIAAIPALAWADKLRLPYTAETSELVLKTHPVGSDKTHILGLGAFEGTAKFDKEQAVHGYAGQIELTNGAGTIRGYAHWSFDDGSSITARYEGIVYSGDSKVDFEAHFTDIQGGGRFEKASGSGEFTGSRNGDKTTIDGQLNLDMP